MAIRRLSQLCALAALVALAPPSARAQAPTTFTVNSTADGADANPGDGVCETAAGNATCTLRAAIQEANAHAGADTIAFNIPPGGVQTIAPASPLPAILEAVTIDGTTQPGYAGSPIVELNGSGAGSRAYGLTLSDKNSRVRGLVVNRFWLGIVVQNPPIHPPDAVRDNVIEGNFIGTDVSGTLALGNFTGVSVHGDTRGTLIGGTTAASRNVISGNTQTGIALIQSSDHRVQGNFIGTQADGTSPLGNRSDGVDLAGTANSTVGGLSAGAANVIAFNFIGVWVDPRLGYATGNAILGNSIHSNRALGIDLQAGLSGEAGPTPNDPNDMDEGANHLQNFPVVTSAITNGGNTTVTGTLNSTPSTTFRLDLSANDACDGSGRGQGQRFRGTLNVTTDASGNVSFTNPLSAAVPLGQFIGATATSPTYDTSEFSPCRLVTALPASLTLTPAGAALPVGSNHTVYATVKDPTGQPVPGIMVRFDLQGAITKTGSCTTSTSGQCFYSYAGPQTPGTDTITAYADTDQDTTRDNDEPRGTATTTWQSPTPTPATLDLAPADAVTPVGTGHTVTATVKDAGAQPVPSIAVRFNVQGSVAKTGSCTTNTAGQCEFAYTGPQLPGADVIAAYADADGNNARGTGEPQGSATNAWTLPTTTPGQVTGAGQVPNAAGHDQAAFGFTAKSANGSVKGECNVVDPTTNTHLKCLDVTTLTQTGTQATIFGNATVNGSPTTYRIDVEDKAEPGRGQDTFRIQSASGFTAGGLLTQGNVQVHK